MKYYCVFDTNVIIAFFLNKNKESSVYKIINNHFIEKDDIVPITNKKILYEYLNVLKRKKFDKIIDREKAIEFLILFYTKSISIEKDIMESAPDVVIDDETKKLLNSFDEEKEVVHAHIKINPLKKIFTPFVSLIVPIALYLGLSESEFKKVVPMILIMECVLLISTIISAVKRARRKGMA